MTTRPLPFPATSRRIALLAGVCLLCAAPLYAADYTSLAGVKGEGFQKWIDDAQDRGFRPIYINGYSAGDHAEFAGVATKDEGDLPWKAKYNMTTREYEEAMDKFTDDGYRPVAVSGYPDGDRVRFAAVWVKDDKSVQWQARHNLSAPQYDAAVKTMQTKGLLPMKVTGYGDPDGGTHFTVLFSDRGGWSAPWESRRDLTQDQIRDQLGDWRNRGFQPTDLSAYDTPDGPRFTATAVKPSAKKLQPWEARLNMAGEKYQQLFDKFGADGYRPAAICGYRVGGAVRYAALWHTPRK